MAINTLVLWSLLAFQGPQAPMPQNPPGTALEPAWVGFVSARGLGLNHISHLLEKFDVGHHFYGSLGYGIFVNPKDRDKAVKILTIDAKRHYYHYLRIADYKGNLGMPGESAGRTYTLGLAESGLDASRILVKDRLLMAMAKEGIRLYKEVRQKQGAAVSPIEVKSITVFRMGYMDSKFKIQPAYRGNVLVWEPASAKAIMFELDAWTDAGKVWICIRE